MRKILVKFSLSALAVSSLCWSHVGYGSEVCEAAVERMQSVSKFLIPQVFGSSSSLIFQDFERQEGQVSFELKTERSEGRAVIQTQTGDCKFSSGGVYFDSEVEWELKLPSETGTCQTWVGGLQYEGPRVEDFVHAGLCVVPKSMNPMLVGLGTVFLVPM